MKGSKKIPITDMPFYQAMKHVQSNTDLDTWTLLQFQIGFKANPGSCACGNHEWSVYDLITEAVRRGQHEWGFYKNSELTQEPDAFFSGTEDITCPNCGEVSKSLNVQYHYGGYIYHKEK
jgi:hypothetical protein